MKKFNVSSSMSAILFLIGSILPVFAFAAGPAPVSLLSAGNFTILAKSGISTTGTTGITGNIGVSPISATAITGFGLTMDSSNAFSTSAKVFGKVYASDYAVPAPSLMTSAISDMQTAYVDAGGRTNPTATELGAGNIGGMTLAPGLYKWSSNVTIPTDVTLSGGAKDVWIFQIAGNLTVSSATRVILIGGASASNIFWQVAGQTTIGTTSTFNGNILGQTAIVLQTGATLNGRALAQTAVTLDGNTVSAPAVSVPVPTPVSTPTPTPVPAPVIPSTPVPVTNPTPTFVPTGVTTPVPASMQTTVTSTTVYNPATVPSKLPNAGIAPDDNSGIAWSIIIPTGIFIALFSFYLAKKKQLI